ncbi:MAG: TrmO family methyltransferase [Beijerinckiaceae bacterium]
MQKTINLKPIGRISSPRTEPLDDGWDAIPAIIELDAEVFGPDALAGLDGFSHVEVIYLFHKADGGELELGARHPRGRKDWPEIGIFAQRGKDRPNHIGATICNVVTVSGLKLTVSGLDAIDGSPVLDLKPVMSGFLPRGEVREPDWARELMRDYW